MPDLKTFTPDAPLILVGCGNMGKALVRGWLAAGLNPAALVIIDPVLEAGELVEGVRTCRGAEECQGGPAARLLLLAVKPQVMNDVLASVTGLADSRTIAISVAAGVTLAQLRRGLGEGPALVRAMPNTPAAVGAGVTGLVGDAGVSEEDKALADAVMRAAGLTVWVESEDLMNAVTAVSGSGPAYVFHLVEALGAAGMAAGLGEKEATVLARQTIVGAAHLLEADAEVPAGTLRERVTSPGGTTAAALNILMASDGLKELMTKAVAAAKKRGEDLAG